MAFWVGLRDLGLLFHLCWGPGSSLFRVTVKGFIGVQVLGFLLPVEKDKDCFFAAYNGNLCSKTAIYVGHCWRQRVSGFRAWYLGPRTPF